MFDNTIDLAFGGGTKTLVRVNQDKFASLYRHRSPEWNIDMSIRHTSRVDKATGKQVDRHNVELDIKQTVTDASGTRFETFKVYYVLEMPPHKTDGDAAVVLLSLKDTMMTEAIIRRIAKWES